jgi:hypothetical protein
LGLIIRKLGSRLKGMTVELWSSVLATIRIPLTDTEIKWYLSGALKTHAKPFYIKRQFSTQEDWSRAAPSEYLRRHGVFRDLQPPLSKILQNPRVVILGEPGAGKSTEARAAVRHLIRETPVEFVPIFGELRGFRGNLRDLLGATASRRRILNARWLSTKALRRAYILDGLDEVPSEFVSVLAAEITSLLESDKKAHLVLTSRQAFYESRRELFEGKGEEFYLLDLTDKDIHSFAEHFTIDYDAFLTEVHRVDFEDSVSNPFTLESALKYFRREGRLGSLRSEIVRHVVNNLIESRPSFGEYQQRRALQMLAVGLETYSRNEITTNEALQILRESMRIEPSQATRLLEELGNSILIRIGDKIAFQTRSYGEYLAANELCSTPLERVQGLVFFPETRIPNESWRNTISYLVELNDEVRRFFLEVHPEWVLGASPAAFSPEQRTELVERVFEKMASDQIYLVNHPTVKVRNLARFATEQSKEFFLREYRSKVSIRCGNALALLGQLGAEEALEAALQVVSDARNNPFLRRSALVAIANLGDGQVVPTLVATLDSKDPLHSSILDAICAIMREQDIPVVMPLLIQTDTMISSAFNRFQRFTSKAALEQVLQYLEDNPNAIGARRIHSYIEPIWSLIRVHWDDGIVRRVARLLSIWERSGLDEQNIGGVEKLVEAIRARDSEGAISRLFLEDLLADRRHPINLVRTTASIMTEASARWLIDLGPGDSVLRHLAIFSEETVRNILMPKLPANDVSLRWEMEDKARKESFKREMEEKQETIRSGLNYKDVLSALSAIRPDSWPILDEGRKTWLGAEVSVHLASLDCLHNIKRNSPSQVTIPGELPTVLGVIGHYKLKLVDDVPLVQCLLGWLDDTIILYDKQNGLSENAQREFDRLFLDPTLSVGAVPNFLHLLEHSNRRSEPLTDALVEIAFSAEQAEHSRTSAVDILDKWRVSDQTLEEIAQESSPEVARYVLDALVARQHRPTIERRLHALIGDPLAMKSGDVDFPEGQPLSWLFKIRTPDAWEGLTKVRVQALKFELPRMAYHTTRVLGNIDMDRLPQLIREQIPLTPDAWKDSQRVLALEFEREASIRKAQNTSFEIVLQKLANSTSMKTFKLWCEGPHDIPVFNALIKKCSAEKTTRAVTQSVNGWNNILSDDYDLRRLADGCLDLMVVMDGDRGRDLKHPKRHLSAEGKTLKARLDKIGIELHILQRYGPENYFSQSAVEAVLERDLTGMFPPSEILQIDKYIPGYSKTLNGNVAERMNPDDVKGTDLGDILQSVVKRSAY